jgi:hypothetical protein
MTNAPSSRTAHYTLGSFGGFADGQPFGSPLGSITVRDSGTVEKVRAGGPNANSPPLQRWEGPDILAQSRKDG